MRPPSPFAQLFILCYICIYVHISGGLYMCGGDICLGPGSGEKLTEIVKGVRKGPAHEGRPIRAQGCPQGPRPQGPGPCGAGPGGPRP